jgi:hypothetical protein
MIFFTRSNVVSAISFTSLSYYTHLIVDKQSTDYMTMPPST